MDLAEFSKEDLMAWIKNYTFHPKIKRSDLLYIKWNRLVKEIEVKRANLLAELNAIDSKKQDKYVAQLNASTNVDEQLRLLELMVPYQDKFDAWLKKSKALDREDRKTDKLYESIEAARQLEQSLA